MPFLGMRVWCTSKMPAPGSNGIASSPQLSAPTATTSLLARYSALLPKPRLAGDVALVILAHERQPASVEDHDVALTDLHPLLRGNVIDLLAIEGRALRHKVRAVMGRHVEQHATGHD